MRLGKTEEAIVKYDIAIASRRSELEKHPTVFRLKPELAGQLGLYGKSLLWLDRLEAAEPILNEAAKEKAPYAGVLTQRFVYAWGMPPFVS